MPQFIRSLAAGVLAGVIIAIIFTAGFFIRDVVPLPAVLEASGQQFPLLAEVKTLIENYYLRSAPDEIESQYGAIRGYLTGLNDPATFFVPPPDTRIESDALAGIYGGIGVRVQTTTTGDYRLVPFPDSPALESGMRDGDLLLAVDGEPIERGTPISAIEVKLRGEVRDENGVTLTVQRHSNQREIFVLFDVIIVPSVLARVLDEDERIGYIQITDFTNRTPDELHEAAELLDREKVDALVLDLRNNGGGLLQEALTVAGEFIADGEALLIERRRESETHYADQPGGVLTDLPLVVLVNGGTASASEVVAGAIEDYERGMLIGQQTYGKGTIQQIIQLSDQSSVHVTFAEWLTPEKRAIEGVGLMPSVVMIPAADGADVELAEAIRQLQVQLQRPSIADRP